MPKKKTTEKEPAKEEPKKPRVLLAMMDACKLEKGKIGYNYLLLDEDWKKKKLPKLTSPNDPRVRIFKRMGYYRPGTVISVDAETLDANSIYPKTAKYIDHVDSDVAEVWAIRSDAVVDAHKRKTEDKKEGSRNLPFEALEPWRTVMNQGLNREQRSAVLSRMISYVLFGIK